MRVGALFVDLNPKKGWNGKIDPKFHVYCGKLEMRTSTSWTRLRRYVPTDGYSQLYFATFNINDLNKSPAKTISDTFATHRLDDPTDFNIMGVCHAHYIKIDVLPAYGMHGSVTRAEVEFHQRDDERRVSKRCLLTLDDNDFANIYNSVLLYHNANAK